MRDHAVLYLNGRRREVRGADLLLPLSTWLRENQRLTGTKIVCAEGDCGACSLLVGRREDPADDALTYRAIDACIAFVYQADRAHVVTVEGLREEDGSLSSVQQAMVACHGSQCGFCTPGFVTTIHAVHEEPKQVGVTVNGQEPDEEEIDWPHALSGNLCRCTGYVQIFDAARAVDPASLTRLNDRYPAAAMLDDFDAAAEAPLDASFERGGRPCRVAAPRTLAAAAAFRAEHPACRVASGTTDLGVQHRHGRYEPEVVLGLHAVDGLGGIDRVSDDDAGGESKREHLLIGAAATWTRIAREVQRDLPAYHAVLMRFGSPQIRNAGTLAGNLANGSPIADSVPLQLVLEAELELISGAGVRRRVPLTRFYTGYKQMDLRDDELIAAVRLPLPMPSQRLSLHKVSKRRDMDISTFTAAILLDFADRDAAGEEGSTIRGARVAYGGVAATVVRLGAVETFLEGAAFTEATMREAGRIARGELTPLSDVRGSAEFRLSLCENVMVKAFHEIVGEAAVAGGAS
ncbi:xanthine dehydrogenase small subunit [Phycisphaera mikurensis]|uniref:Xanthine dehydrogenase small subunit n=1 Tax=Phycisphaera mikurensis (strain NBRC 102666 / KCTC 22515 / FYK2301M01) TaxID=1142394 RepID=I0IIY6_PHYMF|nr:FAD binding domain-containing protein [Phycisphaera mikurensis]MBB6443071.1 xanthine dehydrogenase small subunit [Phycisphaera mikurensis]BAM05224.1 xanthine dehydrogenase small subunit [Phycisphaera mikurensis NBRC 102666]